MLQHRETRKRCERAAYSTVFRRRLLVRHSLCDKSVLRDLIASHLYIILGPLIVGEIVTATTNTEIEQERKKDDTKCFSQVEWFTSLHGVRRTGTCYPHMSARSYTHQRLRQMYRMRNLVNPDKRELLSNMGSVP